MRKTNLNLKRVAFLKKTLVFLFVQIIILVVFQISIATPIDSGELRKAEVNVDDTTYDYAFITGERFRFFSGSDEYRFIRFPVAGTNEYSMHELDEAIQAGDKLIVEYIEARHTFVVIGAQKGDRVLRSADAYNDYIEDQRRMGMIAFGIVEIIYTALLVLFVWFYCKELKLFSMGRKERKKQKFQTQS